MGSGYSRVYPKSMFFTLRGTGDSFEWYAEWPSLRDPLLTQLTAADAASRESLQILVPGCGNSSLSEHIYDAGFRRITNIDFSKVVISDMLRRHIRSRSEMRWRVMDMTDMQFADEFFEVILDKGGLDALMEPELGSKLGSKYLKEVKRVLKSGGKYLCLTLAETHVLGLLFSEFRFGWGTSIHVIPQKLSSKPVFQTFMVSITKEKLGALNQIVSSYDNTSINCNKAQIHALADAVENENKIRSEHACGGDVLYSLGDLKLGAKGNLKVLVPGRRFRLILGEQGSSVYCYKTVLLDAHPESEPFSYSCGVFIVPKIRAHEWLFTSEEGQWLVVESSRSARLIMVFLDSRHSHANMEVIKKDLSPLVKDLVPGNNDDDDVPVPFLTATDDVKQRNIVQQVTSTLTGPVIVEDVIYNTADGEDTSTSPSEVKMFRRLIFERSPGLVQSEAFLTRQESHSNVGDADKSNASLKSSRKGGRKRRSKCNMEVDHSCLASSYHSGIISGFSLIASTLKAAVSLRREVIMTIIGLGAGLLPMFLRGCLPSLDISVVELDPIILDLAKDHFGFKEEDQLKSQCLSDSFHLRKWPMLSHTRDDQERLGLQLQMSYLLNFIYLDKSSRGNREFNSKKLGEVHIGDGIEFMQRGNAVKSSKVTNHENQASSSIFQASEGKNTDSLANGSNNAGLQIIIVDADSSDPSSGLTCPPAAFIEESFLLTVKELLSQGGLFVINLVSRSPAIREVAVSRMTAVFNHLFSLGLEEDVNEILFASMEGCENADNLPEASGQLQSLLKFSLPSIQMDIEKIKRLK